MGRTSTLLSIARRSATVLLIIAFFVPLVSLLCLKAFLNGFVRNSHWLGKYSKSKRRAFFAYMSRHHLDEMADSDTESSSATTNGAAATLSSSSSSSSLSQFPSTSSLVQVTDQHYWEHCQFHPHWGRSGGQFWVVHHSPLTGKDYKLYYEVYGEGPEKILFITGLNAILEVWTPQIEFFRRSKQFQICVFDNRCSGRSSNVPGVVSTSIMARDALGLADFLGWKQFHIVGISLGGMISQELALLAGPKQRVKSVTFSNTSAGSWPEGLPPFSCIDFFVRVMTTISNRAKVMHIIDTLYSKSWLDEKVNGETRRDLLYREEREHWCLWFMTTNFLKQLLAVSSHYVSDERLSKLSEWGIPVLVIAGSGDKIIKSSNALRMQRVLSCKLKLFHADSHIVCREFADQFNQLLVEQISSASGLTTPSTAINGHRETPSSNHALVAATSKEPDR